MVSAVDGTKVPIFKVDLRIAFSYKKNIYRVAVCELSRPSGVNKIANDHTKLLLESKTVMNNMVEIGVAIANMKVPALQLMSR